MRPKLTALTIPFAFLFLFAWTLPLLAELDYTDRRDRHEGVKRRPVTGSDIELLSAVVDAKDTAQKMPDRLKLKFYLERPTKDVFLIVREIDNRYDYWMDNVRPRKPWQAGFDNDFEWPSKAVLQQLEHIRMSDLGVVARLESSGPSMKEKVAPVIFYHSQPPSTIKGYLFTFVARGTVQLTCSLYREGKDVLVFNRPYHAPGGKPFTVRWDSSTATEGWHRLMIQGSFLATNEPVVQSVRFYHRPEIH